MAVRVAINGFGRIGRCFFRTAWGNPEVEIVAINDLGDAENLAYLLAHDSVYGRAPFEVACREQAEGSSGTALPRAALSVNGKDIPLLHEKDPARLPWGSIGVDVVIESTGFFTDPEKALLHLTAGAKRVVISAPAHGDGAPTVLMGVNEQALKTCAVSSNASCTTNAASPIIAILNESIGIERALLNTTHAYTAAQAIVDAPAADDFRRGRAGAHNMAPSSTGAAIAVTKAYPDLAGKFDGIAVRVPVIAGSLVDVTFVAKRATTAEEVNAILEKAAATARWQGIFTTTREPLVSSDIVGQPFGSIADLSLTRVADGTLVKVLAWYDNEMGYTHTLLRHVLASVRAVQ